MRNWDTVNDSAHKPRESTATSTRAYAETDSTEFGRKSGVALLWNPQILEIKYRVNLKKRKEKCGRLCI